MEQPRDTVGLPEWTREMTITECNRACVDRGLNMFTRELAWRLARALADLTAWEQRERERDGAQKGRQP